MEPNGRKCPGRRGARWTEGQGPALWDAWEDRAWNGATRGREGAWQGPAPHAALGAAAPQRQALGDEDLTLTPGFCPGVTTSPQVPAITQALR